MKRTGFTKLTVVLLISLFICSVYSADVQDKQKPEKSSDQKFMFQLSKNDIILPLTSLEWGEPDRFSFTSRYIHTFNKQKKQETWQNNAGVFLSPGISGGRLGINYIGIYSPDSFGDFALFTEIRGLFLQTWGNPLVTKADNTFMGGELRICFTWIVNATIGYYSPLGNSDNSINPFWGFHLGVGI